MLKRVAARIAVSLALESLQSTIRVLTDIAPNRGHVDRIVPPDHHIDELDEALATHPEDVEHAADVPCCISRHSTSARLRVGGKKG